MTKIEKEMFNKLLKIVAENTKAYDRLVDVVEKLMEPQMITGEITLPDYDPPLKPKPLEPEEESKPTQEKEETPVAHVSEEEVRKALMNVDEAGKFRQEAIDLLARYDSKVFKDIKESDYDEFVNHCDALLARREEAENDPDAHKGEGELI